VLVFFYPFYFILFQGLDTILKQYILDLICAVRMLINLRNEIKTTSYDLLYKYFVILTEELSTKVKIVIASNTNTSYSVLVFNWLD
jgi:hypothetical protein